MIAQRVIRIAVLSEKNLLVFSRLDNRFELSRNLPSLLLGCLAIVSSWSLAILNFNIAHGVCF